MLDVETSIRTRRYLQDNDRDLKLSNVDAPASIRVCAAEMAGNVF